MDFEAAEISIGRLDSNDLVLPKTNVSKSHARLSYKEGRYVIADLQSTNGTFVNGRRIHGPVALRRGDKVYIGDFILGLADSVVSRKAAEKPTSAIRPPSSNPFHSQQQDEGPTRLFMTPFSMPPKAESDHQGLLATFPPRDEISLSPPRAPSNAPPASASPASSIRPHRQTHSRPPARVEDPHSAQGPHTSPAVLTPSLRLQGALATLMERLSEKLPIFESHERAFPSDMGAKLDELIEGMAREGVVGPDLDRRFLRESAISEAVGLGPLDRLLRNQSVREVVVDAPSRILADLGGGLSPVSSFFSTSRAVEVVAKRLLARASVEFDEHESLHEAILPDGSHVTVLGAPLTKTGVLFSVRCPRRSTVSPESLITEGMLNTNMLQLLRDAVRARLNILVTGVRGRNVADVLSALAGLAPDHERLVSIEREPRLAIAHPQVIALSRHGQHALPCAALLEQASRLRCDRLVMDEITFDDAPATLMMAASARGMFLGLLSSSAQAGLNQLQMCAGANSSQAHVLVPAAIQLLVHIQSQRDGLRRVESISEVRIADGQLELVPLHVYRNGFQATEHQPSF